MREDLKNLPVYAAPTQTDLVVLANNENAYVDWRDLLSIDTHRIDFNHYGKSTHDALRAKYAAYVGLQVANVLPGPGSEALIPLLINALSTESVLFFSRDFFRYYEIAQVLQRKVLTSDVALGITGLIATAQATQPEIIMLSNPNNPLSIEFTRADLIRLLDETTAYVVIDEAYAEYGQVSVVDLVDTYPKLIVLRTLSKAWGLANLRVGFLLANSELRAYLEAVQGAFVLSDVNADLATQALSYDALVVEKINALKATRADFIAFLARKGISVNQSASSFVYVNISGSDRVQQELLAVGIQVNTYADQGLRITIGTPAQMTQLQQALEQII